MNKLNVLIAVNDTNVEILRKFGSMSTFSDLCAFVDQNKVKEHLVRIVAIFRLMFKFPSSILG